MLSISSFTQDLPDERIAFLSKERSYAFADLRRIADLNKDTLNIVRNKNSVVYGTSRTRLACLLFLLDGVVAKLLLVPKDIDPSLFQNFIRDQEIEYEVSIENETLYCKKIEFDQQLKSAPTFATTFTQWIIPTSGTTGTPKLITHSLESLTKTTQLNQSKGSLFSWGLVFDLFRFSGIQVYLQAILNGSKLIISESEDSRLEICKQLLLNNCNSISSTPSFWRNFFMTPDIEKLGLRKITLGGEIADEQTLSKLKSLYPTATITHIYASTEVGAVFSVSDGSAGFPLDYIKVGAPQFFLKIDNNLLWVKPKNNTPSDATSIDFINTGDLVEIKGDRVYFVGRDSGAINVGGNKVMPEEVELSILELPFVSNVHVYGKKSSILGTLITADIKLNPTTSQENELKKTITHHCRQRLDSYKVPAFINFVREITISSSGKTQRK